MSVADRMLALRRRMEARLRRRIPARMWSKADPLYMEAALDGGANAEADLEMDLQRLFDAFDEGARSGGRARPSSTSREESDPRPYVTATEIRIAALCAKEVRRQIRNDQDVREFRSDYLGGETLNEADARRLLSAVAPGFLSFKRLGGPTTSLAAHRSKVISDDWLYPSDGAAVREVRFRIDAPKPVHSEHAAVPQYRLKALPIPDRISGDDPARKLTVAYAPGSAFSVLARMGERIAGRFHWSEADAVWFLLTDEPPDMPAIRSLTMRRWSSAHGDLSITLTVRPWVSPQSVARFYRYAQNAMLGRRFRPFGDAQVKAWEFIESRTQPDGTRPPWPSLFAEWRQKHRGSGATTWKNFARDFHRVRRAMMPPGPTWDEMNRIAVENEARWAKERKSRPRE